MVTQTSRNFRNTVICGVIALVLVSLADKNSPFIVGLAIVAVPLAAILLLRTIWSVLTHSPGEGDMMRKAEALPYKNFYGNTGIALDVDKRELHLYQKPHYVVYPLEKIRSWSTNVQTGGNVYGTGLAVAAGNIGTAIANNKATGLFIEAKDIDHPKWRIVFSGRGRDREMARWMEILNQHVNEDR